MNGRHETYNDWHAHCEQTGHAVIANQSGGEPWGWCYEAGMPLTPDRS